MYPSCLKIFTSFKKSPLTSNVWMAVYRFGVNENWTQAFIFKCYLLFPWVWISKFKLKRIESSKCVIILQQSGCMCKSPKLLCIYSTDHWIKIYHPLTPQQGQIFNVFLPICVCSISVFGVLGIFVTYRLYWHELETLTAFLNIQRCPKIPSRETAH